MTEIEQLKYDLIEKGVWWITGIDTFFGFRTYLNDHGKVYHGEAKFGPSAQDKSFLMAVEKMKGEG